MPSENQVQRVLLLRSFPAFAHLAPEEVAILADHLQERFFEAGSVVFEAGSPVAAMHFILEGEVDVLEVERRGSEALDRSGSRTIRTMHAREAVGGLAALTGETASAVAVADTWTLQLNREDMEDVFEDNFVILMAVTRALARTLINVRKRRGSDAGFASEGDEGEEIGSLDLVEKIFYLSRTFSFTGAEVAALAELARESEVVRFAKDDLLWEEGDPSDQIVALVQGKVRGETESGQRFTFSTPMVTGGLDALAGEPRWYTAVAETEVVGLKLKVSSIFDVYEDNIKTAMGMLRALAGALEKQYRGLAADQRM